MGNGNAFAAVATACLMGMAAGVWTGSASGAEPSTTYRWMEPGVPGEGVPARTSVAPRRAGVDAGESEALLEVFGKEAMPKAWERYLALRNAAEEAAAQLKELFPDGKASDPSGGEYHGKMLARTEAAVAEMFQRRDELCFFLLMRDAGVFTAENLARFDGTDRMFGLGPEGVDYPGFIDGVELVPGEANEMFAETSCPGTLAAFRALARSRSEGAEVYNRLVRTARTADAVRAGADLRILAERLRSIKTRLKETDNELGVLRMQAAVDGSSPDALAQTDRRMARELSEFADTLPVRTYYLRRTRLAPIAGIKELGEGKYAGDERRLRLPGGTLMEMVWCPPGSFVMGSPVTEEGRVDNETQHRVTLTEGFWMAKHEVTQKQWNGVMGDNPSEWKGDDLPVENVSYDSCTNFCAETGLGLPTEAQWEYACRAGSTTALPNGDIRIAGENNAPALDDIAWYGGNSSVGWKGENGENTSRWRDTQYPGGFAGTHPVGRKLPNAWGLHDMIGNVAEWCADQCDTDQIDRDDEVEDYPHRDVVDPSGSEEGEYRVIRGGAWNYKAGLCRSANRAWGTPRHTGRNLGFRPCVTVSPAGAEKKASAEKPTTLGMGRQAGETKTIPLPSGETMDMVWCPPGRYESVDDSGRRKAIRFGGFWMAKTEVTQAQWRFVKGRNPSRQKGDDLPVENVTWKDAEDFCRRVGYGLRLPTLEEWEYACLAGGTGPFGEPPPGGSRRLADMGWYSGNSPNILHLVGQKQPNAWGLYDMHGNASEFCGWCIWHGNGTYNAEIGSRGGNSLLDEEDCQYNSGDDDGTGADNAWLRLGFRPISVPE